MPGCLITVGRVMSLQTAHTLKLCTTLHDARGMHQQLPVTSMSQSQLPKGVLLDPTMPSTTLLAKLISNLVGKVVQR